MREVYPAAVARLPDVQLTEVVVDKPHADDFDAVVLLAGTEDAIDLALRAASLGKHVFFEAPLMRNADRVIAECQANGVRLMVGWSRRFLPSIRAVRESLDAGQLGKPGLLRIHRWVPPGDGVTAEWLMHEVDLANWLFGQPPTEVYALSRGDTAGDATGGYLQVHLGFPDGGMGMIDVSTTLPDGDGYYSLSLIGTDGAAYADDHHNVHLVYGGGNATAVCSEHGVLSLVEQLREFATAIGDSREPAMDGASALRALQVTEAARSSMETGSALHRRGERYESA